MLLLLLLFVGMPILELWLLVQLSGLFGFWTTLAIILGTGILGAWLARWQGFQAINRLQSEMRQGMLPAQALGDGALILVAGILLITPGVISDMTGLALLVPPFRKLVLIGLQHWFANHVRVQTASFWSASEGDTVRDISTVVDARVIDSHVLEQTDATN